MSSAFDTDLLRTTALSGLIDYAGLFPPASLDLDGAMAGYERARSGSESWIVDRFISPVAVLGDVAVRFSGGSLSVLLSAPLDDAAALERDLALLDGHHDLPVTAIEARLPADASDFAAAAANAKRLARDGVAVFVEVPHGAIYRGLEAIAAAGLGAKLRCGGLEPSAFPPVTTAATFIRECVRLSMAFKATAGLHHPVRHLDEELGVHRHGFLNLLAATACAVDGGTAAAIEAVVDEGRPDAFALDSGALRWHDQSFSLATVREARLFFAGYGSCDFDEPVEDLQALGWLPEGQKTW